MRDPQLAPPAHKFVCGPRRMLAVAAFGAVLLVVFLLVLVASQGSDDGILGGLGGGAGGGGGGGGVDLPSTGPPAGALVGKQLSDFKWVDSKVIPRGAAPEIENITQVAPGVFRHWLRVGKGWHDGDRDLTTGRYALKGRAEMNSLGGSTPMKKGETWLIGSTVKFDDNFVPGSGFCDIAQPVLFQSYFTWGLKGDTMVGQMMVFERGLGSPSKLVREVKVKRGQWFTWTLKVKLGPDGYYGLSVDGDAFQGFPINTEIGHVSRATVGKVSEFGGTWGLYGMMNGPPRDMIVYHANPFLKKVS